MTVVIPYYTTNKIAILATKLLAMTEKTIHEGRNVKRIREILSIKQGRLSYGSRPEPAGYFFTIAKRSAQFHGYFQQAIKNFDERAAINVISSTFMIMHLSLILTALEI